MKEDALMRAPCNVSQFVSDSYNLSAGSGIHARN